MSDDQSVAEILADLEAEYPELADGPRGPCNIFNGPPKANVADKALAAETDAFEATKRLQLQAALKHAEARHLDKDARYDGTTGIEEAIFAVLYDAKHGLTHKQIQQKLSPATDNQLAWRTIDRLIREGKLVAERVKGNKRHYSLITLAGIPYKGAVYSLRQLEAHRDNRIMHDGKPLSYGTIKKRLDEGLSPTLALLRPRQERKKWR